MCESELIFTKFANLQHAALQKSSLIYNVLKDLANF